MADLLTTVANLAEFATRREDILDQSGSPIVEGG
jgi:hypothetical protein